MKKSTKSTSKRSAKKKSSNIISKKTQAIKPSHRCEFDEDGFPQLNLEQLMTWRASMAEAELARMTWQHAERELELYLKGITKYNELRGNADGMKNSFAKMQREYMRVLASLSSRLGIDLKKCIINDQSGRITFTDEEGNLIKSAEVPENVLLGQPS